MNYYTLILRLFIAAGLIQLSRGALQPPIGLLSEASRLLAVEVVTGQASGGGVAPAGHQPPPGMTRLRGRQSPDRYLAEAGTDLECGGRGPCTNGATCVDNICECGAGWLPDPLIVPSFDAGWLSCVPHDECSASVSPCTGENAVCINADPPMRFKCDCPPGFTAILAESTASFTENVPLAWRPLRCIPPSTTPPVATDEPPVDDTPSTVESPDEDGGSDTDLLACNRECSSIGEFCLTATGEMGADWPTCTCSKHFEHTANGDSCKLIQYCDTEEAALKSCPAPGSTCVQLGGNGGHLCLCKSGHIGGANSEEGCVLTPAPTTGSPTPAPTFSPAPSTSEPVQILTPMPVPRITPAPSESPCTISYTGTAAEVIAACGGECCYNADSNEQACSWPESSEVEVCRGSCMGRFACQFEEEDMVLKIGGSSCIGNKACLENKGGNVGDGSCVGELACFGTTSTSIGDGSCNAVNACSDATGIVGDMSCTATYSCAGLELTAIVGSNSCTGEYSCVSAAGIVGNDSCTGGNSCGALLPTAKIGNKSCTTTGACGRAAGTVGDMSCTTSTSPCGALTANTKIGDRSCTGSQACGGVDGMIGNDSCTADQSCGGLTAAEVGDRSCTGIQACGGADGTIGDDSCTADNACGGLKATAEVGNNSCTAERSCVDAAGTIGDGSCTATNACPALGKAAAGAAATVGNNSCTAEDACTVVEGVVGDGSCTDKSSCAVLEAAAKVGNLSCSAEDACRAISQGTVGNESCKAEGACYGAFGVGDGSCTHPFACFAATVGNGSCTGANSCTGATVGAWTVGVDDANTCAPPDACIGATVGDGCVDAAACS